MKPLQLPSALAKEFATVDAIWGTTAETRALDALLLSWVKYEKQLRRLFTFLVFQHPKFTSKEAVDNVVTALVESRDLYPGTFEKAIKALKATPVPELVGARYKELNGELSRIKKYRNKLMHGQLTGQGLSSADLERDVKILIDWCSKLADGAQAAFGFDGFERKSFYAAKRARRVVGEFPFQNATEFKRWLTEVAGKKKAARAA